MGSNLGLFLGGSFITLAETVQLILSLILSVCLKPPPEPEPPGPELTDVEREAKLAEYRQMLRELKAKRENEDEDDDSDESEEENEEKATKI